MLINNSGHMNNMAIIPIYGKKKTLKTSSLELGDQFQRNLACSISGLSASMCI